MPLILRDPTPLSDLSLGDLRERVTSLNDHSGTVGGVIFPASEGHEDRVLIIFAGFQERFYMLSAARYAACKVVYLQDEVSRWYQGSDLLPPLDTLCEDLLREEIGSAQPTFFGQSSGGYACLYAAARFERATAVACSPQTFSDRALKAKLHRPREIDLYETPDGLVDLKDQWGSAVPADRFAAIVVSASEQGNEANKYWLDHLHCFRMVDAPEVHVFLRFTHQHAHVHRHAEAFARLIVALQAAGIEAGVAARCAMVSAALDAMDRVD